MNTWGYARLIVPMALTLTLIGLGGCEGEPECGDGLLTAGEACDDGNRANGDGCSASCEPDDDLSTPGDDRSDFFYCANNALEPGVTCPVGTLCCLTTGPSCATPEEGCLDPINVALCDGPEDCAGGEECWRMTHDRACRSEGILAFCHTDGDCASVSPWLPDGTCTPEGTCVFDTGG
ncbi:MAG: hypothetical protein EOO73_31100 [Myxococcales bacterium]|nr:MAG: hypothetical protein EOO73_31100 [Myxococcales bacterium]